MMRRTLKSRIACDVLVFLTAVVGTTALIVISEYAGWAVSAITGTAASALAIAFRTRKISLRWLAKLSANNLTELAVLLAGRRRPALHDEWRAHLAGESGHDPVTSQKVKEARGFVLAAVRYRLADVAEVAWEPIDAMLGSRTLSNLFVWGPVIAVLVAIVHHDGRFGLVADIQDPVALGAFLFVVIRTGRWWRGVKPPDPKAKRAKE